MSEVKKALEVCRDNLSEILKMECSDEELVAKAWKWFREANAFFEKEQKLQMIHDGFGLDIVELLKDVREAQGISDNFLDKLGLLTKELLFNLFVLKSNYNAFIYLATHVFPEKGDEEFLLRIKQGNFDGTFPGLLENMINGIRDVLASAEASAKKLEEKYYYTTTTEDSVWAANQPTKH